MVVRSVFTMTLSIKQESYPISFEENGTFFVMVSRYRIKV